MVANRAKHIDDGFHDNVSLISQAIEQNRRIEFQYFRINIRNQKQYDKRGHYTSPWLTLYHEDNYYLVGYDRKRITYYRIDRITDVTILDEPRQGEEEYEKLKKELPFRTQSTFNLFGGEKTMVTLWCPNFYYYLIVDKFGSNLVPRLNTKESTCEVDVPVVVNNQFLAWIVGLKNKIRIVGPEEVRQQMNHLAASVLHVYPRSIHWEI